jgi:hypothetical protein
MQVTVSQVGDAIIDTLDGKNDFFPYEYDDETEINNGMCDDFAQAVCAYLDFPANLRPASANFCAGQEHLWGHVWLELVEAGQTTYFDSEAPDGVAKPEELEFYNR